MLKIQRRVTLRLVLATCCLLLFAATGSTQPMPDKRSLVGRVTGADGMPLKEAVVTLRRQSQSDAAAFWGGAAVTDAHGRFSFPHAEDGSYYITVETPGFAPVLNLACVVEESTPVLEIKLAKLGVVKLRVLRSDGTPLATSGVSIRLREAEKSRQTLHRTRTDKEGVISLSQIVPARYSLFLVAPSHGYAILNEVNVVSGDSAGTSEARLKPGGVLRLTAREPVSEEVPAQATSGGGTQDGSRSGRPLGGATVALVWKAAPPAGNAVEGAANLANDVAILSLYDADRTHAITRDGDGVSELSNLAPGRYQVALFLKGYTSVKAKTVDIEELETVSLDFFLEPHGPVAALEVSVQNAGGEPATNMEFLVSLHLLPDAATDTLGTPQAGEPIAPMAPLESLARRARSNAKGRSVLYPVRPGKWRVTLSPYQSSGIAKSGGARPVSSREVMVTERNNAIAIRLHEAVPARAKTVP